MSVSLRCSDCGHANPPEAHFCGNCGASLSTAVEVSPAPEPGDAAAVQAALSTSATPQQSVTAHCRRCGYANPAAGAFCGNCGSSLSAEETSSPRSAAAVGPIDATAAPTEGVEYAGFWRRAVAWLVDSVILYLSISCFSLLIFGLRLSDGGEPNFWAALDLALWVAVLSVFLVPAVYGVLFVGLRGQTPGKMLLHVRVVNDEGRAPGFWRGRPPRDHRQVGFGLGDWVWLSVGGLERKETRLARLYRRHLRHQDIRRYTT